MDDSSCLCSVLISYDTKEEREWLDRALERARTGTCDGTGRDDAYSCASVSSQDPAGVSFCDRGPCAELCGRAALWVYAEAYVFGDVLAALVARFHKHLTKDDFWECQCAYAYSSPQLDAYGGYGMLVHHGEIRWFIPGNDIPDTITERSNVNDFARTLPPS